MYFYDSPILLSKFPLNNKIMKPIYLITFLFLFSCKAKNETGVISIDPNNFIYKAIKLSDFAEDIEYIPLSNEKPISAVFLESIDLIDNNFIIAARPSQIGVYNRQGQFLNNIGREGRGPGEYHFCFPFATNDEKKLIYLLNTYSIIVYNYDGDFLYNINISDFGERFDEIQCDSNFIYLFRIDCTCGKYNWVIINEQGEKVYTKKNFTPPFDPDFAYYTVNTYKFSDHYCYWNNINDTIFDVSPTHYSVRYTFARNKNRLTPENFKTLQKDPGDIYIPRYIGESNKFLFLSFNCGRGRGYALIDKSEEISYAFDQTMIKTNRIDFGFINDFDSGLNFAASKILAINKEYYMIGYIDAYRLKAHVQTSEFKNSTPKYPEKKRELEELANSLNNNDNPVLMLVKLKE